MEDIRLLIYRKFMCLKSHVEVYFNFSLIHDQNVLFQQSICHCWAERQPFTAVLIVFGKRLGWAGRKDYKKSFDPPYSLPFRPKPAMIEAPNVKFTRTLKHPFRSEDPNILILLKSRRVRLSIIFQSRNRVKQVVKYIDHQVRKEKSTTALPESQPPAQGKVSHWIIDFDVPSAKSLSGRRTEWDKKGHSAIGDGILQVFQAAFHISHLHNNGQWSMSSCHQEGRGMGAIVHNKVISERRYTVMTVVFSELRLPIPS